MDTITLNKVTHRRIENYAKCTGQSVTEVAREALNFWMDTMGDAVLEELERREIEASAEQHARDYLKSLHKKQVEHPLAFPLKENVTA
jgi:hypothetical protein